MAETKKTQLTQNAYDKLRSELEYLEGEAREHIIKEIATARAHGDLSENAEYHTAKDQQGLQEGRARQIRAMLENAEVVEAVDDGVVKPGMVVTIKWEDEDEPESYFIGQREEKESVEHPVLTPESPIGQALVGRSEGETVIANVQDADKRIEILEVKTP
ncbi:MAG: transcription elongation factor GreA [Actinomycetota bacterium]